VKAIGSATSGHRTVIIQQEPVRAACDDLAPLAFIRIGSITAITG
jgi:hypothetical protein